MSAEVARLHAMYESGRLSPVAVVEDHLARARARGAGGQRSLVDEDVDARAREVAARSQERYVRGVVRSPWDGVPVTVAERLWPPSAAAALPPGPDAPVVARLRQYGAPVVARTWAVGMSDWDGRDPPEPTAAGIGFASLVVDTCGSARGPAVWAGGVGFEPTLGTLPSAGVVPVSPTLDHIGIVARSVEDARLVFEAVTRPRRRQERPAATTLRLGVVSAPEDGLPEVAARCADLYGRLDNDGVELVAVDPLPWPTAAAAVLTILCAEALEVHRGRLSAHWQEYADNVRNRMLAGATVRGADYVRARAVRTALQHAWERALAAAGVDLVAMPNTPYAAGWTGAWNPDDLAQMVWFTGALSLLGVPAVGVPVARGPGGLAVGVQIAGRAGQDHQVLDAAARIEQVRGTWPVAGGGTPGSMATTS